MSRKLNAWKNSDKAERVRLEYEAAKKNIRRASRLIKATSSYFGSTIKKKSVLLTFKGFRIQRLRSTIPQHLLSTNDAPTSDAELEYVRNVLELANRKKQDFLEEAGGKVVVGDLAMVLPGTGTLVQETTEPEVPHEVGQSGGDSTVMMVLDEFIGELKGILSPHRRLPSEVLQLIFLKGSYATDMRKGRGQPERPSAAVYWPWILSRVCKGWREICVNTPELWNYLPTLQLKSVHRARDLAVEMRMFELMLERSRNSHLDIAIRGGKDGYGTHPFLWTLNRQSNRWDTFSVTMRERHFNLLFSSIKGHLKHLRFLWLSIEQGERLLPITPLQWDILSDTPSLQNISLAAHYTVSAIPTGPLAIIANATNLHTLQINLRHRVLPVETSSLILPHLKHLSLSPESPSTFLDIITAPTLEELEIKSLLRYSSGSLDDILVPIISFIQRSTEALADIQMTYAPVYTLERLYVGMRTPSQQWRLISIVEMLPRLVALHVALPEDAADFLKRLASTDPIDALGPNIEYLIFETSIQSVSPTHKALIQMAKIRCSNGLNDSEHALKVSESTSAPGMPFKRLKLLVLSGAWSQSRQILEHIEEKESMGASYLLEGDVPPDIDTGASVSLEDIASSLNEILEEEAWARKYAPDIQPTSMLCGFPLWIDSIPHWRAEYLLEELEREAQLQCQNLDLKGIYMEKVHVKLMIVKNWLEEHKSCNWRKAERLLREELYARSCEVLNKWCSALEEYAPKINWMEVQYREQDLEKDLLIYVPPDHPIRSSPKSIMQLTGVVYDSNKPLGPFSDLFDQARSSGDCHKLWW